MHGDEFGFGIGLRIHVLLSPGPMPTHVFIRPFADETVHLYRQFADLSLSENLGDVEISVTRNYGDTADQKVNELLLSAASLTDNIDHSIPAFVRQKKLDDFYIVYELNAYTTEVRHMHDTYSELHKYILDVFERAGIEILSPHYRIER